MMELNPFIFSRNIVESYVTDCVQGLSEDALYIIGKQGGYISIPQKILLETPEDSKTSLLVLHNVSHVPVKSEIEKSISEHTQNNLIQCLDDFAVYEKRGIEVDYDDPEASTFLRERGMMITVDFRLKLTKKENSIAIDNFRYEKFDIRLPYILEIANQTANFLMNNPNSVDLTELSGYDVDVAMTPLNSSLVLLIHDQESQVKNNDYKFRYALTSR